MKKSLLLFSALLFVVLSMGQNSDIQRMSSITQVNFPDAPAACDITGGITGDAIVCRLVAGVPYSITPVAGATNYVWSVPAGAVLATGQGTTAITVNYPAGSSSGNIMVYAFCPGGPGAPVIKAITVLGPNISGNTNVCKLSTWTYITEPGMTNYVWTRNGANVIAGGGVTQNFITLRWIADGSRWVRVTYTDPSLPCTSTTTLPVNVQVSSPTISGSSASCKFSSNTYTTEPGMVPGSYVWTVSPGNTYTGGGINDNFITITWNTTGAQWFTVNYTSPLGCTITPTTFPVQVWDLPVISLTGPAGPFCSGTAGNTYTTDLGKSNYIWTVSPGNTVTSGGGFANNTITVTWNASGPQWVSVNYTDNHGSYYLCSALTAQVFNVLVNPKPIPTITGPGSICGAPAIGKVYTTQSGGGINSWVWTVSAGGTIFSGQGTSSVVVDWNVIGNHTLTVTYIDGNGCIPVTPTVKNVVVSPLPTPTITAPPLPVCVNSTGNVYTTEAGQNNYIWVISPGGTITSGGGLTDNTVTVTWNTAGPQSVSVNYADPVTGCFAATSTDYLFTVTPTVGTPVFLLGPTSTRCQGAGTVTYTATATNSTGITYSLDAASITGGNSIVPTTGAVTYVATWNGTSIITASASGCNGPMTANHTVTINPLPVTTASSNSPVCLGGP
jgi:hypothetical protein